MIQRLGVLQADELPHRSGHLDLGRVRLPVHQDLLSQSFGVTRDEGVLRLTELEAIVERYQGGPSDELADGDVATLQGDQGLLGVPVRRWISEGGLHRGRGSSGDLQFCLLGQLCNVDRIDGRASGAGQRLDNPILRLGQRGPANQVEPELGRDKIADLPRRQRVTHVLELFHQLPSGQIPEKALVTLAAIFTDVGGHGAERGPRLDPSGRRGHHFLGGGAIGSRLTPLRHYNQMLKQPGARRVVGAIDRRIRRRRPLRRQRIVPDPHLGIGESRPPDFGDRRRVTLERPIGHRPAKKGVVEPNIGDELRRLNRGPLAQLGHDAAHPLGRQRQRSSLSSHIRAGRETVTSSEQHARH